jgi:hypothetical protein
MSHRPFRQSAENPLMTLPDNAIEARGLFKTYPATRTTRR